MNPVEVLALPDVQAELDERGVALDEVGIDNLSYPIALVEQDGSSQQTVAHFELVASLTARERGTHMSRFVEIVHAFHTDVRPETPLLMARELRGRLGAGVARVELSFPVFFSRSAPVSGATSLMRFDCRLVGSSATDAENVGLRVRLPVTSLCPCSKEISDYGAHSQRGYVDVSAESANWSTGTPGLWLEDLLLAVENSGSAPIYPLLKRVDERYVTMLAFDNPAFVEDVARDVAVALSSDERVLAFDVAVANEESIHDHRAVARVRWRRS